ncbi:unnamed protein product [Adineta ricciae]|uniref:NAD(P)(+)--arginine ADP-ribosyltransferase n=1 Tax=Adineta ricciae TaxID=249248 RepID=A0A814CHU8_ADIRI|nr:unnamed protein product [Adineta ricciae]CAF1462595.1 unnamed protein product [Adineta ricciae]
MTAVAPQPFTELSPLYVACRANNVHLVEQILANMSIEEINRIESNGSTALHVVAYNGHIEIVRLLLGKGASMMIRNRFGLLPVQEARTDEIKKLFEQREQQNNENRFVGDTNFIEWLTVNERAAEYAVFYRDSLKDAYENGIDCDLLVYYLKEIVANNPKGMLDIIYCFRAYFESKDATHIVKAYTVESDFYRTLNKDLAKMISHRDSIETEVKIKVKIPGAIAAVLSCDPALQQLSFTGDTFRGMCVTTNDLDQYKPGSIIMTKSFLSTSKNKEVAEGFITNELEQEGPASNSKKISVICRYSIRNRNTALAIETLSIFKKEEEVLILPINVFKVVSVQEKNGRFEIKLVEQERLARLSLGSEDPKFAGVFGIICHFAFPSCYRKCCMRCCGVVEAPE